MDGSRRFSTLLDLVSVGLLAVAIWLFWDARGGTPSAASPQASAVSSVSRITAGRRLAVFAVADSAGEMHPGIAPDAPGTLLFVFRSDCPACAAQKSEWQALAGLADSRGLRTVAYTPEPLAAGVPAYFGDAPVTVMRFADDASARDALDLRLVPTTFVVDAGGRVRLHHQGVMPPSVADSVRRLVGEIAAGN